MSELETEYQAQLRELLRMKRRLLHEREMQLARGGVYTDPSVTIARDELRRECADIEARLGIVHPAPPRPRPHIEEAPMIERSRTSARQRDIEHQLELLRIHRANLAHYRAQADAYGGIAFAPPVTRNGMNTERAGIARAKGALAQLGVVADDLPGDE